MEIDSIIVLKNRASGKECLLGWREPDQIGLAKLREYVIQVGSRKGILNSGKTAQETQDDLILGTVEGWVRH